VTPYLINVVPSKVYNLKSDKGGVGILRKQNMGRNMDIVLSVHFSM
jgi:hypothetical protein